MARSKLLRTSKVRFRCQTRRKAQKYLCVFRAFSTKYGSERSFLRLVLPYQGRPLSASSFMKGYSRLSPFGWSARGLRRHKLHIPCFPANGKASSFRCGSLPNQSQCFDLERKNGGADAEPSRLSAAASWSKPVLTMPRMSPEKRI